MIYRQTINVERIALSPLDNVDLVQFVDLVKFGDAATFAVSIANKEDDWYWEFDMSEPSDYERVKMNLYDAIFECDTVEEFGEALDALFEDGFDEILIYCNRDEEEDCEECEMEEKWEEDEYEDNEDCPECGCCKCPYKH